MSTVIKQWGTGGGTLTLTYDGVDNGSITMSSTTNEGLDRSIDVTVKTLDNSISKTITINQTGKRDKFLVAGEPFIVTNGEFLVLK